MKLHEAMSILGLEFKQYFADLGQSSNKVKLKLASGMLEIAKKRAKMLMAKNHPDIGGSQERFRLVNEAISFIESDTENFVNKLSSIIEDNEKKSENRLLIVPK